MDTRFTKETGIVVMKVEGTGWGHFDTASRIPSHVGPWYRTKQELMGDHLDYLLRAGWLSPEAGPSKHAGKPGRRGKLPRLPAYQVSVNHPVCGWYVVAVRDFREFADVELKWWAQTGLEARLSKMTDRDGMMIRTIRTIPASAENA